MLEILCLAHRYGIDELVKLVSKFLKSTLHLRDVSKIYNHANMFELEDLVATTSEFMDRNAKKVLVSEDFLHLSANALVKLVEVSSQRHIFLFSISYYSNFRSVYSCIFLLVMNLKISWFYCFQCERYLAQHFQGFFIVDLASWCVSILCYLNELKRRFRL